MIKNISTIGQELNLAVALFREYAAELNVDLCFQHFEKELKEPLKKYGPPAGRLLMAWHNNEPAGCIALQPVKLAETCEMKRLYIRPAFRKRGLGDNLVKHLLKEAKSAGYNKMVLDTIDILQPAISLYKRNGFQTTVPYYLNPLPGVIFMERDL